MVACYRLRKAAKEKKEAEETAARIKEEEELANMNNPLAVNTHSPMKANDAKLNDVNLN